MAKYDGLIIPRSYSEYINKTDAATHQQAHQVNGVLDAEPTENSNKAVKSGGVYDALAGKQPTLTFDDEPTDGSNNPVKSNGIYDALAEKQDTLTFDDTPTASSNNPVKSGGVKSAISNAIDYSETETDTGAKWIDGKPIYRRVFTFTTPLTIQPNSWTDTNISKTGFDSLISIIAYSETKTCWNAMTINYGTTYLQLLHSRSGAITVKNFVLEYTKT